MNLTLFLNDLEKTLTIFKTETEVQQWLFKNNLTPNVTNYKKILSHGHEYIKKNVEEIIKDLEIELLLNDINSKTGSNYAENFGVGEIVYGGYIGLSLAAGLCVLFPLAIVPTLLIGGVAGIVGGNISLKKMSVKY